MNKQANWHKMVLRTIDFLKAYKSKKGDTHPRKWLRHAVTQCDAVLELLEKPEYRGRPWEITTDQFDHGDWEPDYLIIRPEWLPEKDGMSSPSVDFMTPCLYLLDSFEYNGWMEGCGIDGRELTAKKVREVVTSIKKEAEERLADSVSTHLSSELCSRSGNPAGTHPLQGDHPMSYEDERVSLLASLEKNTADPRTGLREFLQENWRESLERGTLSPEDLKKKARELLASTNKDLRAIEAVCFEVHSLAHWCAGTISQKG